MFNPQEDVLHVSIIVTGKCNASCEYCHFYGSRNRKDINKNIDEKLFERYIAIIKYLKDNLKMNNLTYRFSGGEPLILGDKLYELSNNAYSKLGEKPYILTNGKALNKEVVDKSKENNIGAYIVSIENPFDVAKGAVDPDIVLEKIRELNSDQLPIVPGVLIVSNSKFHLIGEICDYVYTKIKQIPIISEKTFTSYERPTNREYNDLYENLKFVIQKYIGNARLEFFPYIIPELNTEKREFLVELDLNGDYISLDKSVAENAQELLEQINKSYPIVECIENSCDCYEGCNYCKWLWQNEMCSMTKSEKMLDYCNFKKTLYRAYADAMIGVE